MTPSPSEVVLARYMRLCMLWSELNVLLSPNEEEWKAFSSMAVRAASSASPSQPESSVPPEAPLETSLEAVVEAQASPVESKDSEAADSSVA